MSTIRENYSRFADDYADLIRELSLIVRKSGLSMDQIADLAGIVNEQGEASRHKIYKFWECTQMPTIPELKRLINFFESSRMVDCVNLIHAYLFVRVGVLMRYREGQQCNGSLDDDFHHIGIQLGQGLNELVQAQKDGRIDAGEAQKIQLCLDRLEEQVQCAKHELAGLK